jgi:hypothetical protein
MFHLGRANVLPVGDLAVRKGMQLAYGLKGLPTPVEMESVAAAWAPYRSLGTYYMWRALEDGNNEAARNKAGNLHRKRKTKTTTTTTTTMTTTTGAGQRKTGEQGRGKGERERERGGGGGGEAGNGVLGEGKVGKGAVRTKKDDGYGVKGTLDVDVDVEGVRITQKRRRKV